MPELYVSRILENGLLIQLLEIHTVPLISQWIWYRVGSRNEQPGITGISHWVEHMQFKGTPKFPLGVLDRMVSKEGGIWNAMTYMDWTTYFETMPADKIDVALELEVDRMRNSNFDKNETEAERTVVISEREGNENEPLFLLNSAVQLAAFQNHPYRHEVIGELQDLQTITQQQLLGYYQTYYAPNNAVLALAGDFDAQKMMVQLEKMFAEIAPVAQPTQTLVQEPEPNEEKRVEVHGPGETRYLQIAYQAPAANNGDFFPMTVLDSLLSGPSSLIMFGGGSISNRTSRLYQALVEKELAMSVSGGLQATIDPFLHSFLLTLHPQADIDAVLRIFDEEMERVQNEQVDDFEIARAIKQAKAMFAYGSENITNQAFWLGYANMFANYDWYTHYVERLEQVSKEDIQNSARNYLIPKKRVVGIFTPSERS